MHLLRKCLLRLLTLILLYTCSANATPEDDKHAILDGVNSVELVIDTRVLPLSIYGENAFALATTVDGSTGLGNPVTAFIAGSKLEGGGRVIAFGRAMFLETEIHSEEMKRFLANAVRWAANGKTQPKIALYNDYDLAPMFRSQGLTDVVSIYRRTLETPSLLNQFDVLISSYMGTHSDAGIESIRGFLKLGKGLLGAATNNYHTATYMRHTDPGNRILSGYGIAWTPKSITFVSLKTGDPVPIVRSQLDLPLATKAVDRVAQNGVISDQDSNTIGLLFSAALPTTPLISKFLQYRQSSGYYKKLVPNMDAGIPNSAALQLDTNVCNYMFDELPPEQITAHPAAVQFPGMNWKPEDYGNTVSNQVVTIKPEPAIVDEDAASPATSFNPCVSINAPELDNAKPYTVNHRSPALYSTGMYALAGTVVTIEFPQGLTVSLDKISVQIGNHMIQNLDRTVYYRWPVIQFQKVVQTLNFRIASALGGPIYITLPTNLQVSAFQIKISGAVAMTQYIHGVTTQAEWDAKRATRKSLGAPWMEFTIPGYFSILAPSDIVKVADKVSEAMTFFKRGIDDILYLGGFSRIVPSQRLVIDSDANGNGAYAGYPITTTWSWGDDFTDGAKFCSANDWGWWHEMGHNFQYTPWAVVDSREVTNNIFSMYNAQDKNICGQNRNLSDVIEAPQFAKAFIANGKPMDAESSKWNVWYGLLPYYQIQKEYGWQTFKRMFAFYNNLRRGLVTSTKVPSTVQEQADLQYVVLSRLAGQNLDGFYASWNIEISDAAKKCIGTTLPSASIRMEDLVPK